MIMMDYDMHPPINNNNNNNNAVPINVAMQQVIPTSSLNKQQMSQVVPIFQSTHFVPNIIQSQPNFINKEDVSNSMIIETNQDTIPVVIDPEINVPLQIYKLEIEEIITGLFIIFIINMYIKLIFYNIIFIYFFTNIELIRNN
jgi:hypothetical protein